MRPLALLGPQRLRPTLADAFERLGAGGPVAAVTAGWQEREGEDEELAEHLGRPVTDLRLHARCEEVFAEDPELFRAHRARQDRLREMQRLYRYRLDFAIKPARALLRREGDPGLLEPEREAAIAALRRLDREHLRRIAAVHRELERGVRPLRRRAVRRHRDEIAEILERSGAVAIAGGHVAVLVNRLRLLGVAELLAGSPAAGSPAAGALAAGAPAAGKPVFAWSAGAMALGERIVLFHDRPPWGAGNAEVLDVGLGAYRGLVPLPDARHRLRLADPARVALLARRLAPALCVPLDEGDALVREGEGWRPLPQARRLTEAGGVEALEAA